MNKEKYIETVLKEVKFYYDHQEIEKELETHIYERSKYLQSKGLTAESAETEAVKRMGDPQAMGRELNKAHNPWLGYVWLASCIFAFCLVAAAAWFGAPKVYEEIKDLITEPTPIEHFAERDINNTLCRAEIDESLFLDGYEIHFTEAALVQNSFDKGGYYLGLFYEHIGEYGKKVAEYLRNFDYYDNKMFLDEEGQYFSYREETVNEPYVITYHSRHYYEIWIPDLSKTMLYVDYNAFGQQDKCEIDLSSLFEEIKTKEAQL